MQHQSAGTRQPLRQHLALGQILAVQVVQHHGRIDQAERFDVFLEEQHGAVQRVQERRAQAQEVGREQSQQQVLGFERIDLVARQVVRERLDLGQQILDLLDELEEGRPIDIEPGLEAFELLLLVRRDVGARSEAEILADRARDSGVAQVLGNPFGDMLEELVDAPNEALVLLLVARDGGHQRVTSSGAGSVLGARLSSWRVPS